MFALLAFFRNVDTEYPEVRIDRYIRIGTVIIVQREQYGTQRIPDLYSNA